ncbi:hypothetical protein EIP86_001234 [Pleurotus ostreatoroseus]|nr:hypothetical protein EIP86_001234 [Pleurotus ostreatoroseus]
MSVKSYTTLGGTASEVKVAKVAHGLMNMHVAANVTPDETCFETIKAGVDLLPPGAKMILNSGDFYDNNHGPGNLEMVSRFFEKHPEYAERTFLSVKPPYLPAILSEAFSRPENLRQSVEGINAILRGKKRLDLFQCARVDPDTPIDDVMQTLRGFVREGLFDHIGMSECSAATLRKANAVHPIALVEIEVSPWSMEEETKKVLAATQELGIAVAAYSPLGRGFLTGSIKSLDDIPEGDWRRGLTRFSPENFQHNFVLVDALKAIAEKKGMTPAALCIAWVATLGPKVIPLPGSSSPQRHVQNVLAGDVEITPEESAKIWEVVNGFKVKGDRYFGDDKALRLWG